MSDTEQVVVRELWKSYGHNPVLRGVSVEFERGAVHALLGANGAGKSTLLGCLSGAVQPEAGDIVVDGTAHEGFTPRGAFDAGIAIIYQHFQQFPPLTVADNIFLGREIRTPVGTVDRRAQVAEARQVLTRLGIDLDPKSIVEELSVGQQQMVEIARAIHRGPSVLILDEPTAALGRHEVAALLDLVRHLAHNEGIAVVYVTHLLGEVMEVADKATILRNGQVYWTRSRSGFQLADLIEGISPSAVTGGRQARDNGETDVVLDLVNFYTGFTGPVDLSVRAGEVLGVFGLLGSGRTDLLETLAGVRSGSDGSARIDGREVDLRSPSRAGRHGVALVASDRKVQSLFGDAPAIENLLMPHYSRIARGVRRTRLEQRIFANVAERVGLVPANPHTAADSFSGGNAQKIAVARWALDGTDVRCLLLDEPTQGVDIGARADLYRLLREFAGERGMAIVFATSDPEEILTLADRVLVLIEGSPVHLGSVEMTESELAHLAQPASTEKSA